MELGRVGIWTFALDMQPAAKAQEAAAEIESLGFGAIWIPEAMGREAVANAALLLAATRRITIATGIASIWARDPMAAAAAQKTLCEAYGGRFLLGLGVSHAPMVAMRGHQYEQPVAAMRRYLDAMDSAPFLSVPPATTPKRVLAALHPKMLELARNRADGSHTYCVPPEHTAWARQQLGADKILAVEQTAVLVRDPEKAREVGRRFLAVYLGLPNYARNLRRFGFTEDDLAEGGSDRLVDALVAWGDETAIARRVREQLDAGASHVCVQVLDPDPRALPLAQWRSLAPALLTL
jgi:probable F420-dependent oxidoreductase